MCASPVTTTVRTGVWARAPRTKGSTWSQVTSTVAPASVSWAARSATGSSGFVGGEGGAGQHDPVVDRRVLAAVRDVDGDDVPAPDAVGGQPPGGGVRPPAQLLEGERYIMVDEGGAVTPPPDRRTQDRPDGHLRVLQRPREPRRPAGGGCVRLGLRGGHALPLVVERRHTAWLTSHALSRSCWAVRMSP